jgi:hypothetical protein
MQVERPLLSGRGSGGRVRNTWISTSGWGIPARNRRQDRIALGDQGKLRASAVPGDESASDYASWWGNGSPGRRSVAGLRGRSATLGLRTAQTPTGGSSEEFSAMEATLTEQRRVQEDGLRVVNCFSQGRARTVPGEQAPANYVPAAAVIRRGRALSGFIGRKASAGGVASSR